MGWFGVSEELWLRWTPRPVIVTIRDNSDYIRVLMYSYYTTITGWGVLLSYGFLLGIKETGFP